ncbi:exodeoxyribonuclease VII large subunit [Bacillus thermotolerans]|uniref:exodeoxyribonuclease VII large subunit n=1 Tax=Bacillus thermotolerans TaxID=1221996 RepID=UPI00057CDF0A|nr:exodeoxyribonuclease VII large subunit [Bacillus thermotolerans]KKB37241.1 Exodeoxyribonuclease VII large subunit [Bacillus thermotolerans]KKB43869.1 Exodeoxyribonuclease VII large subunit [Bacillus thermotolerans]
MEIDRYLTVKALTKYIKRKFDADPHLTNVLVKGEISNFKRHSSGHMYFTLKDEKARVLAVMFSSANRSLKFVPENGMQVLVSGDVTVYEAGGQYQIYVKSMQPDGIGSLYLAFEQLKKKLEKEGLFDPDNKRPLPIYPKTVGVVTSPTGAAVRDIITTIKRRYPVAELLIYPALVQGEGAAPSIVAAVEQANKDRRADVLIVGRGGGSIEELWAFNEEAVARAIRSSAIPVISAVGHETDITIADFAADRRAPTPTAGAEIAVPHLEEVLQRVADRKARITRAVAEKVRRERSRYESARNSYIMRNPQSLYRQQAERLDRLTDRLAKEQSAYAANTSMRLKDLTNRLQRSHPAKKVSEARMQAERLETDLAREMQRLLKSKQETFRRQLSMLHALSPLKIMERGYSLVYNEEEKLIKSIQNVQEGERLGVQVADGKLICQIESIEVKENGE